MLSGPVNAFFQEKQAGKAKGNAMSAATPQGKVAGSPRPPPGKPASHAKAKQMAKAGAKAGAAAPQGKAAESPRPPPGKPASHPKAKQIAKDGAKAGASATQGKAAGSLPPQGQLASATSSKPSTKAGATDGANGGAKAGVQVGPAPKKAKSGIATLSKAGSAPAIPLPDEATPMMPKQSGTAPLRKASEEGFHTPPLKKQKNSR